MGWIGQVFERIDRLDRQPSGPPGIVGFGLTQPRRHPAGLGRRLPQPRPDHSRAVHTAPREEIPGRLANSSRPGRLGHRRMHARQSSDDRPSWEGWTRISFSITKKSRSAARPQDRGWRVEYDPGVQSGPPTSLAESGYFAQDAGHHPAQQAALLPQALAPLAVPGAFLDCHV